MKLGYLILGLIAGMGLPIQAAINTRLGAALGSQPLIAALISFAVGTLVLLAMTLIFVDCQAVSYGLGQFTINDWWKWLGGFIGAFFVFMSIFLAPKIGVANMVFLFILGQLMMSMLVDSFGLFGMPVKAVHWSKFFGIVMMLIGAFIFMFGTKWLTRPT